MRASGSEMEFDKVGEFETAWLPAAVAAAAAATGSNVDTRKKTCMR